MHIALYQPDIPQNLGALLRLSACMNLTLHVIEPCGFVLSDSKLKRAGMDYIDRARWQRHADWNSFLAYRAQHHTPHGGRLLLAETDGTLSLYDTQFHAQDILLFGSESRGTPQSLYPAMDSVITIPMRAGERSLNLALSAAMCVSVAYKQLRWML